MFVALLHKKNCSHNTVNVYLAGVRALHISEGFSDPLSQCLRLKLAVRAVGMNSAPPKQKLPITLEILEKMFKVVGHHNSFDYIMFWSALTLGYFGLLRAAEFTVTSTKFNPYIHLTVSDIHLHNEASLPYFLLNIKNSKTDKLNKGVQICIGCSGHEVCALCAAQRYLQLRLKKFAAKPLDPFFIFENGQYLTKSAFVNQIKLFLSLTGIDPSKYSAHSLRAGGATDAALSGLQDWEIKQLGRWSSSTYQRYIRIPLHSRASMSKGMISGAKCLISHCITK